MSLKTSLTMWVTSILPWQVISPPTITVLLVMKVSHATWACSSNFKQASKTASLILSAILSGCPSLTDSDVNNFFSILFTYKKLPPEIGRSIFSSQLIAQDSGILLRKSTYLDITKSCYCVFTSFLHSS